MVNDHASTGFQGKHSDERFQFYFRQHWIRLFPSLLRVTLINVAIFALGYASMIGFDWGTTFVRRLTLITLATIFMGFNIDFLYRFYRYFLYVIVVTDRKLHRIKKTLIMTDDHQSIDLWSLQDVHRSQRGLMQNLFQYGSITLEAQETVLRLHFVPRIAKKYVELLALQQQARSQAGGAVRRAKRQIIQPDDEVLTPTSE